MRALPLAMVLLVACSPKADTAGLAETGPSSTACDPAADADGDGLDDCAEVEDHGTDPNLADSDGDGSLDGEELACLSDPLNGDEACYACGWLRNDPGTLSGTGTAIGDTVDNLSLVDQCGDAVDLWDFAGEYHVLFMTGAW